MRLEVTAYNDYLSIVLASPCGGLLLSMNFRVVFLLPERKPIKTEIINLVRSELDQFGVYIINVTVKSSRCFVFLRFETLLTMSLIQPSGGDYFFYLQQKAREVMKCDNLGIGNEFQKQRVFEMSRNSFMKQV